MRASRSMSPGNGGMSESANAVKETALTTPAGAWSTERVRRERELCLSIDTDGSVHMRAGALRFECSLCDI